MVHTTPFSINEDILEFCNGINSTNKPIFVDVIPDESSESQECFNNVKEYIKKFGGGIQYGWTIWEIPKKFIEAEFHAVWVDKNGKYIDITPKPDGEEKILFIKDNSKKFTGELVNNIRKPLIDNAETRTITIMGNKFFDLSKKYYDGSKIKIPMFEMERLGKIRKEIFLSELQKDKPEDREKISKNKPCPCGSGKKYKMCCFKF